VSQREVSGLFGDEFADAILQLESGSWIAPVRSAFGVHAIRVDEFDSGRPQTLDEARAAVVRDWTAEQRKEISEAFYSRLLEKYDVNVLWPEELVENTLPLQDRSVPLQENSAIRAENP
jgi:parvulin-like peptidyl-prolyl isomerase